MTFLNLSLGVLEINNIYSSIFVIHYFSSFFQTKMKSEGKYVNLPGASHGNIVTRFPPEASG